MFADIMRSFFNPNSAEIRRRQKQAAAVAFQSNGSMTGRC